MGEVREAEAQLMEGSAWAERICSGGFTAASSSPAFGWSGGGVLGSGVGEMAKERGEQVAGVFVVLLRARDLALGCYSEPSTAAARWRPAVDCCCVARRGGHSARDRSGGELRRDAWEGHVKQEVASRPFHGGGGAEQRRRQRSRAGRQTGGRGKRTEM